MISAMAKRRMANWRIDEEMLERLDEAASALEVHKSDIVRLSLALGLAAVDRARANGKTSYMALAELQALAKSLEDETRQEPKAPGSGE